MADSGALPKRRSGIAESAERRPRTWVPARATATRGPDCVHDRRPLGRRRPFVAFGPVGVGWTHALDIWLRNDPADYVLTEAAARRLIAAD